MLLLRQIKKALLNPFTALLYILGVSKCYSQLGEDMIIDFLMLKDNHGIEKEYNGFYIDIGGNLPIHANNTYLFYKK
jgi:hypothetical protein